MQERLKTLDIVLVGLMRRYKERVPDVAKIIGALKYENVICDIDEIENDHIAFRTLGVPNLGIGSLEKIFLHYGYERRDYYHFNEKKLNAYWYAPPLDHYPRIFISELRVHDLTTAAQETITSYTNEVVSDPVDELDLNDALAVDSFLHRGLWRLPGWSDYLALSSESEYAGWTIYNRYYLNHFTISVHNLKEGFNTIEQFNQFLLRHDIKLNNAGGVIKKSPDDGLLQSSTVAQVIEVPFADGDIHSISGSYVEFAERRILPDFKQLPLAEIKRQHRREGFEAANADKIFESTYSSQTNVHTNRDRAH